MPATLSAVAYLGATILFILSLGGLSNPERSRRGNLYGMIGMTIAVLATVLSTTGAGVVLARLRLRSRSVLAPVLAHAAVNVSAYLAARHAVNRHARAG